MFKQLKKEIDAAPKLEPISVNIPRDPQEFFFDFGGLQHPRLRENDQPVVIKELFPYQYEFWKYQGNALAIKSQKIGLTTSSLLEDFQFTLLPEGAGKDVLIIAQSQLLADDHILSLKRMVYHSPKYSELLITTPDEIFREEKTKASVIYVRNPYNRKKPSRIIGLGKSEPAVWSWKNVGKVHMSDVAKLEMKEQTNFFAAVYSRLANTNGTIKIETPPNGQQGEVFNIWTKAMKMAAQNGLEQETLANDPANIASKFRIFQYPVQLAVNAGMITQEFLDQERRELGDLLFSQLYECNFLPPGNQWYNESMFDDDDYGVML